MNMQSNIKYFVDDIDWLSEMKKKKRIRKEEKIKEQLLCR